MMEDKLTREERIRLDCLNQATAYEASRISNLSTDQIIGRAAKYENFVKNGKPNDE